jgi:hypothetical protein
MSNATSSIFVLLAIWIIASILNSYTMIRRLFTDTSVIYNYSCLVCDWLRPVSTRLMFRMRVLIIFLLWCFTDVFTEFNSQT